MDRIKDLEKKFKEYEDKVLDINEKLIELSKLVGVVKPIVDLINKTF